VFLFLLTLRLELQLVDPVNRCRGWHLLPPPHLTAITYSALLIWTLLFWLQVWLLCCIRFGRRFKFQGKVEDLVPSCTLHVDTVKWSSRGIAFNHTTDVLLPTTAVPFKLVAVFLFRSSFHGQYPCFERQALCLFQIQPPEYLYKKGNMFFEHLSDYQCHRLLWNRDLFSCRVLISP